MGEGGAYLHYAFPWWRIIATPVAPSIEYNNNMYFGQYSPEQKFLWLMTNENLVTINKLGDFLVEGFCQQKLAQNQ